MRPNQLTYSNIGRDACVVRVSTCFLRVLVLFLWFWSGNIQTVHAQPSHSESGVKVLVETAGRFIDRGRYDRALERLEAAAGTAGISTSMEMRPDVVRSNVSPELTASLLLQRGLAQEGLGKFFEARNDYLAFLTISQNAALSAQVRERMGYIDREATRYLAGLASGNEEQLSRYFQAGFTPYAIGVLPYFNLSDNPELVRTGYGISGFVSNILALLDHFTDKPFEVVERTRLDAALSEMDISRFYDQSRFDAQNTMGKILGAAFVVSGILGTNGSSLVASSTVTDISAEQSSLLPDVVAKLDNSGLRALQERLVLDVTDELQRVTGFRYVPSRAAFEDSVRTMFVDDVQQFLAYGEGLELAYSGALDRAGQILADANIAIARRDLGMVEQMRLESQSANLAETTAMVRSGYRRSSEQIEILHVGLSQTTLGVFGVDQGVTGTDVIPVTSSSASGQTTSDNVPGSQNPSQLPVQVIRIILPPPPVNG